MNEKLNIFILAAGLGERLRPITDYIPKPLVPVLGTPVLQHVLNNVSSLPFHKIGINLHYKMEVVEKWISQISLKESIVFFPEQTILGTGGALKNAEGFLSEGPFLVHNADILTDIHLEKLLECHISSNNLATLAVHDHPQFNSLLFDEQGYLIEINRSPGDRKKFAFTGIAVYEPEFLKFLPPRQSSVVDIWMKAVSAGHKIGSFDVCRDRGGPRPCWSDVGTPSSYAAAVFAALRKEGETVYVHRSVKECRNINIQGHVVIEEGAEFSSGVSLNNCIVLPGSKVGAIHESPLYKNCVIGPDFKIDLKEREFSCFDEEGRNLIGTGGSDRKFYRIMRNNKYAVLMQSSGSDPDFERQIEYSRFFLKNSVPVPQLKYVESEKRQIIFEDAGDVSLYSYLKCHRDKAVVERVYKKVIDALVQIHTGASENVAECTLLRERIFDYEHFRWETDYFLQSFVKGVRNLEVKNIQAVEEEFHNLASKADSFLKRIIHRDFQSQNVIIMTERDIRVIDYQGARIGPPAYDVASLLWDPYYRLEDGMRGYLLDYYCKKIRARGEEMMTGTSLSDSLLTCRLQRHMQALGAYGFLSSVKGKKYFLKFVPEGLRLLKEDMCEAVDMYPELFKLIVRL